MVGISTLLYQGIGDTIRVSLTTHPREEVIAGYEILKSLNLRQRGPVLVSCPACGRAEVDIIKLAEAVEKELLKINKPIKVAVMGCVVNGPGKPETPISASPAAGAEPYCLRKARSSGL